MTEDENKKELELLDELDEATRYINLLPHIDFNYMDLDDKIALVGAMVSFAKTIKPTMDKYLLKKFLKMKEEGAEE